MSKDLYIDKTVPESKYEFATASFTFVCLATDKKVIKGDLCVYLPLVNKYYHVSIIPEKPKRKLKLISRTLKK